MLNAIERRRQFIQEFALSAEEQTCDLLALAEANPAQAAYKLASARAGQPRALRGNDVPGGETATETREAESISLFVANEVRPLAVRTRERLLGRIEPLTYAQAVTLLTKHAVKDGGRPLTFEGERGIELFFRLDPRSRIAWLPTACHLLALLCHWSEAQAARFILLDESPMLPAISVTTHRVNNQGAFRSPITVTLLPHVSDMSLLTMVRRARRTLSGASKGPLPEVRRQAMTDFVLALKRRHSWTSWPAAHRDWARVSPRNWRYPHWRTMERSFGHETAARARVAQDHSARTPRWKDYMAARVARPRRRPVS